MKIEVSIGEVVDKLTILDIKKDRIKDSEKLSNVEKELDYLFNELLDSGFTRDNKYYKELYKVNLSLWEIEDEIRLFESKKDFGSHFIELARSVYKTNDERAKIKKAINLELGLNFIEEKSYQQY